MLPKNHRLSKKDIEVLFKKGEGVTHSPLFVRIRKTEHPLARFCILFAKNIKLGGVERNNIRRQVYGAIGKKIETFQSGHDYGMMITPKLLELKSKKRLEALNHSLTALSNYYG